MFIITGDHGMREDGNHGGNSLVERESLLFAYYKPHNKENLQTDFKKRVAKFEGGFVSQVDLTATISVLLNVPHPMNSIGCPIIEILPEQFKPYLTRILHNTLDQYKLLIQHYPKQCESRSTSNTSTNCLTKITSKQYELLQLLPNKITFE